MRDERRKLGRRLNALCRAHAGYCAVADGGPSDQSDQQCVDNGVQVTLTLYLTRLLMIAATLTMPLKGLMPNLA